MNTKNMVFIFIVFWSVIMLLTSPADAREPADLQQSDPAVYVCELATAPDASDIASLRLPESAGAVVVDDPDAGCVKGGIARSWRTVNEGYNGRMLWTKNNDRVRAGYNWMRWYPTLQRGQYEVFVYIPHRYSTTANARYWVSHAGGYTLRRVNQSAYSNQWVSLGTYWFRGTRNDYVSLADVTYERYLSRLIAFDAVKWEPRGTSNVTSVSVYFSDENRYAAGTPPFEVAVTRTVPRGAYLPDAVLQEFFKGPTTAERARGLEAITSGATGFSALQVRDGIARIYLTGTCQSGGATYTIAQPIMRNLLQFGEIQYVKIYDAAGVTAEPTGASNSIPPCLEP